jgi:hypothetical protein
MLTSGHRAQGSEKPNAPCYFLSHVPWELSPVHERFAGILRLTHLGFFSVGCLSRQPREEAQTDDLPSHAKAF